MPESGSWLYLKKLVNLSGFQSVASLVLEKLLQLKYVKNYFIRSPAIASPHPKLIGKNLHSSNITLR
jgi:hypothetical protein